ncbi:MAG: hypothetical protein SVM86_08000 [Candidatus Cloacimonadota bacterium]|nr:hypothetical protein [Candidatus Cloacimonadota bacterium]
MKKISIFKRDFFELTGCIHNHSEYSKDSSTPIKEIKEAAKACFLDYFTLNDHMNAASWEDKDIQDKDLIVIPGMEINDPNENNHLLVFNSKKIFYSEAEEYVKKYKEDGAITFAAHPFEKRATDKLRKYIWTNKKNDLFDGLEIWNGLSDWVGKIKPNINGLLFILFPSIFIKKPSRAAINYWDKLNRQDKKKSAIGSVDAHHDSYTTKFGLKIRYLSHKFFFKTIRTNIYIPAEKEVNAQNILEALKKGNSYIINYKNGIPYNFFAGISNKKNSAILGEEIKFNKDLRFYYRLPKIAKVKLKKNGLKVDQQRDENGFFTINGPGNYRLEISNWGRGWIYTNNIYVK